MLKIFVEATDGDAVALGALLAQIKSVASPFTGPAQIVVNNANASEAAAPAPKDPPPKATRARKGEDAKPAGTTAAATATETAAKPADDGGIFGATETAAAPATAPAETAPATTAAPATSAGGITADQLKQKVLDVSQKLDAKDVINLVEKISGKRKASEVPADKYDEVFKALENMLAAHEAAS